MHDTLDYFKNDPVFRKFHHDELTFSLWYAFNENFTLPLSHDEVVHGKGSLMGRMPGDAWQQFANLRLLFGWMWGHPGKKLLFMGCEFGQRREWTHEASLEWHVTEEHPEHAGVQRWVADLNAFYRKSPSLHATDFSQDGFRWVRRGDWEQSVLAFLRNETLVILNFTPVPRRDYRIGVPRGGFWREALNSDAADYGGSGAGNFGGVEAQAVPCDGHAHSITLTLPPLGAIFLQPA
jgi:1,4-alpha-glucan branching enzyme